MVCCTLRAMMPKTGLRGPVTGMMWSGVGEPSAQAGVVLVLAILEHDELVGRDGRGRRLAAGVADGVSERLARAARGQQAIAVQLVDQLAATLDLGDKAGVEAVGVDLLVLEVLGRMPSAVGLDAGGEVLGDKDGALALRAGATRRR
jgi:hypothetical protein